MSVDRCTRLGETCIQFLAGGWILPTDLCPCCTRAFMTALDWVTEPVALKWHQNFRNRASGNREGVVSDVG